MLTIRLSRQGRKKRPFYRIVLTEHTKPIGSGFKEVLGWFDPLAHQLEANVESIIQWIGKGASVSERTAKLLFNQTKDKTFSKFIVKRERTRKSKKEDESAE